MRPNELTLAMAPVKPRGPSTDYMDDKKDEADIARDDSEVEEEDPKANVARIKTGKELSD